MIGLIAAEKSETGNLVKAIQAKIIEFNGVRYYIGNINGKQVVACFCGIGKTNAAMTATNMIINFGVDKIFNIGLCGSCKTTIKPGSTIIADNLQYSDVDLTAFNYQLNQLPEEPLRYEVKREYINYLKSIIDESIVGTVATADAVISINNIELFPALVDKDILGYDMEATAIAQVCKHANVDFLAVKLVSDNITFDTNTHGQYNTNYKSLAKKIEGISLKVLEYYSK
ncbi:MAG: 5'-methylthioadenosine/S-adenosylhomocysteine nucleosidase [Mycoplasmoidaceae bacterium]|nr:5'-methylthioadenosine/S-adenosylhomocysteine nucleosidase [Mycoplasmoidaceae bacterium]